MNAWQPIDLREDPDERRYVGDPSDLIDLASTLVDLAVRPAWMADALCREHPEVEFFVARGEDIRPAKDLCSRCLVCAECQRHGISREDRHLYLHHGGAPRFRDLAAFTAALQHRFPHGKREN